MTQQEAAAYAQQQANKNRQAYFILQEQDGNFFVADTMSVNFLNEFPIAAYQPEGDCK